MPSEHEKAMASLAQGGSLGVSLITGGGFGWVIPLVIYLTKGRSSGFIAFHAKQAMVLQFLVFVGSVILGILGFVTFGITWALMGIMALVIIILQVLATIKAYQGEWYGIPVVEGIVRR